MINNHTTTETNNNVNAIDTSGKSAVHRSSVVRSVLFGLVLVLGVTALASDADAAKNRWYGIKHGSSGASVMMTSFKSSSWSAGSASGKVAIRPRGGCFYVQAKPVARAALDGSWKRQTVNVCGSRGQATVAWRDSFRLAYNGFKFRLCQDRRGARDTCGTAVTIYP